MSRGSGPELRAGPPPLGAPPGERGPVSARPPLPALLGRFSRGRLALVVGLGLTALVLAIAAATVFGGVPLAWRQALSGAGPDAAILWDLRLPRVLLAALVGAGLCGAGAALQGLLANPLADPFVLGVSGGAAVGVTAAVLAVDLLGFRGGSLPPQIAFGFAGALLAAFAVRSLGSRGGRLVGAAALLAGAVLNAAAGALVLLAQLALSPDRAQQILWWLAGSLGYPAPATLALAAAGVLAGGAGLVLLAGRIRLLSLGEDEAAQLGVDVKGTVRWTLAACALAVASAVAVSGLIGFVGLLVPHLLRLRIGPDQRLLVPASILGGAAFLVLADAAGRLAFLPLGVEPPVGALTALLGGPLFLVLLRRGLREET